jgi:hypothetical protein
MSVCETQEGFQVPLRAMCSLSPLAALLSVAVLLPRTEPPHPWATPKMMPSAANPTRTSQVVKASRRAL